MGLPVRAAGRSLAKLRLRPFAADDGVALAEADVLDAESLRRACAGCEAAYYLVHSMVPGQHDFSSADRDGASNMARAAESAGLSRILYLGGLIEPGGGMSEHLRSRAEVGEILASGPVPVTTLRAAMVIGAGSGSFEILRYLVDRLPLMVTPRWVGTESQPISIRNVLDYLAGCLAVPETAGEVYDIGGPDIVTYRQMMRLYAEEADLPKRRIVPVPVLTPRLSSYWIHLITPVPAWLAMPLAEGLSSRLVCRDNRIRERIPVDLLDCRSAVREALRRGRWEVGPRGESAEAERFPEAGTLPGDPAWAGGTVYTDHHVIALEASPEEVWDPVARIGGNWRVAAVEPNRRLLLVAEMRLPGCATLEFRIRRDRDGVTRLHQLSTFAPRGLAGVLYWKAVNPLHHRIFTGMLEGIARSTGKRILAGPEHPPPTGSASDSS